MYAIHIYIYIIVSGEAHSEPGFCRTAALSGDTRVVAAMVMIYIYV